MSSQVILRIAKLVVGTASLALTFVGKFQADKMLDEKIAAKVAEEMAKNLNK